jgi:hypothetical protein
MMADNGDIKLRWEVLGQMDRAALRVAWAAAFGDAPPHFLSMIFMRKALIWHAQCLAFGGLTTDVKRGLKSAVGGKTVRTPAPTIKPGTQLVREWNGRRYLVEVRDDGFRMNSEHYKSLSAIALQITGTTWSGPRFFGLNGQAGGDA